MLLKYFIKEAEFLADQEKKFLSRAISISIFLSATFSLVENVPSMSTSGRYFNHECREE